jgi:uncharacterized membrane protein
MKRDKILYWMATGLVSAGMMASAWMYLSKNEELMKGFTALGFPLFFVTLLGIAKLLGAIALIIPKENRVKEWAYAGFLFTFVGAIWTHVETSTPFIAPLVFLLLLAASYIFRERLRRQM